MRKFELTEDKRTRYLAKLSRVRALRAFGNVREGETGGFVESEANLDHSGNAWVYEDAEVYQNARVSDNAWIYGNARVGGNARICGDAEIYDNACVDGEAYVGGDAKVGGNADLCRDALVCSDADYVCIRGLGSSNRTTTFFRTQHGIGVSCGCFSGSLQEFRERVKEKHGDGRYAKEYLMAADLMELHFDQ